MKITVNGEDREYQDNISLQQLITKLNIEDKVMAAAVNMEIVKKDNWSSYRLKDNDRVELLHFVGGGWKYNKVILLNIVRK